MKMYKPVKGDKDLKENNEPMSGKTLPKKKKAPMKKKGK